MTSASVVDPTLARHPGTFLTPAYLASAAHQYLCRSLTDGTATSPYDTHQWWDMFCGSGRLLEPCLPTMAGRLYASTLAHEDVLALRALQLPVTTNVFAYDFLDQTDTELPDCLRTDLKLGSKWVFLLNPPFVGQGILRGVRSQANVNTRIRAEMVTQRLGRPSLNLTAQALFRLLRLTQEHDVDATVGVFSQASIWVNEGYTAFRKLWQGEFGFSGGFMFDAREFSGVTGAWPAVLTIWSRGRTPQSLLLDVMESGVVIGQKELREAEKPLSRWVPRPIAVASAPQMTSAVTVATGQRIRREKLAQGALGYVCWLGNDVRNSKGTYLLSVPGAQAGWSITPEIFEKSMVAVAARVLVRPTWLNDADQFSEPNTSHPHYQQFVRDAVIWLIGAAANHTASLGSVAFEGQTHDVINHLFWMLPEEMLALRDLPDQLRAECVGEEPRFLSYWLQGKELSRDAAWVLAELTRLIAVTAAARPLADPNLQLSRWDAGYWQLRRGLLWPSSHYNPPPNVTRRYRMYKRKHRLLGQRLERLVYELGFLPSPMLSTVPEREGLAP